MPGLLLCVALVACCSGEPAQVIERWPDGTKKITARDWREAESSCREQCGFAQSGKLLGCATLRDGEPFEGALVDFETSAPEAPLREIRRYKRGKRHGIWRSYIPELGGDVVGIELEYDADRLVSRKVRTVEGKLELAPGPAPFLPGTVFPPPSPRRPLDRRP